MQLPRTLSVLTYTTALRRFFGDGGVLRRWHNPMWGGFWEMETDGGGNRRRAVG